MNTFRKVLIAIATTAALGATATSAFAGCYESYQPSYYQPTYDSYAAYDNSDYGYSYNSSDHRGFGRFEFRGHSRRH
jgi:hypothetical protein